MELKIKGHSGCDIDVVREARDLFVYKSTHDVKYIPRLINQAKKQEQAASYEYQHIRVPQIFDVHSSDSMAFIKMEYVYSKNFIEYFEHAGFEQIKYLIKALEYFIEKEIAASQMTVIPQRVFTDKFFDVKKKTLGNSALNGDTEVTHILNESESIFSTIDSMCLPVGRCHGDLTFSNILFNGNNYYLIDFLDSFIESPMLDIVKLRQDTAYRWSQRMYIKSFDSVRLRIVSEKIDHDIDEYFKTHYGWYRDYYKPLQVMNFLRILQYAHEPRVIEYLKRVIISLL